jgi:glycerol kinase
VSSLVIDVGTSSVRTCLVHSDGTVTNEQRVPFLPQTPFPGLVEFDPVALLHAVTEAASETIRVGGSVDAVGITNQRGSTVLWDATTGLPVANGLGWQDLRTIGACIEMNAQGFALPPNASATKVSHLLDLYDPDRSNVNLRFGTIDSWLVWNLTSRAVHATDASNAAITSLVEPVGSTLGWREEVLAALRVPHHVLPDLVDSFGIVGQAVTLPGAPPIAAILGDQQASLLGQGCIHPGDTKATFGTGGMVDIVTGSQPPSVLARLAGGTFPIAVNQRASEVTWGLEAIMLSAGSAVEWLRDDLQIISTSAESASIAGECPDTDGVSFVPALLGLATPHWDYGARGTLVGMTRGTTRAHIVRAVLEGVALRGADLIDAVEADAGVDIVRVRIDGGMSENPVFVQAFADACARPVEVSAVTEATALGVGLASLLAVDALANLEDLGALYQPARTVEPSARSGSMRNRWADAVDRSKEWIPALSALDF